MKKSASGDPAIIVLTGASGAGKTTLLLKLGEVAIPGVKGINCDRVKINAPEITDPSELQAEKLRYWISQIRSGEKIDLVVLDTQIRPHRAQAVLNQAGVIHTKIVLVDCDPIKRNERLRTERGQPELANPQMDCWSAYLRGQADALKLPIIDTSEDSVEQNLEMLIELVKGLLNQAKAAAGAGDRNSANKRSN